MGRKRKRGQTKQNWGTTSSRKQKKRMKIRGKGFKNGGNMTKEVDLSEVKSSNSSCSMMQISLNEGRQQLASPCCSRKVRLSCGKSAIVSHFFGFLSMFQRSTLQRLRSIRNVFLLLDWLKQTFGCGLQKLGKFLLEKDHQRQTDRGSNFEDIRRRMENLEEEVKVLKTELAKRRHCPCGEHSNACTSVRQGFLAPSLPSASAPVPPPPPPPPVLPPPPPPLVFLKNNQTGLKGKGPKKIEMLPQTTLVTLEDLKKVKLRKVDKSDDKENLQPEDKAEKTGFRHQCNGKLEKASPKRLRGQRKDVPHCIISVKEIKEVNLKRTKTVENEVEKIKLRTPEEMLVMRRNLRKVNITRSPGGTPLVSERNYESGTGLTPMMTKALRRKFQQAHPYSPESPKQIRGKKQSFSPLADCSPNTPSPLLINKF